MSHPSQVIVDAVAAIDREDWNAFINLCDPVSLRRFKNELVWQFSDDGYSPDYSDCSLDEFLRDVPEMTREDAEFYSADMHRRLSPAARLNLELSTVSSVEELKGLEPREVLIRWLKSRMPRKGNEFSIKGWEPPQGLEAEEGDRLSLEELDDFVFKAEYVVLGSVRDGPEFAHVVCRHADRHYRDEEESEDNAKPRDEAELDRAIENRTLMLTALCRRQPDETWRLIAERNLFFLPTMSIVT